MTPSPDTPEEALEEIAERIARSHIGTASYHDTARKLLKDDVVSALRNASNRTCPECVNVAHGGSGYCSTCDSFTMPSDFSLRWVRRTQMDEALRGERERAASICEQGAMLASPDGVIPADDPEHERLQRLSGVLNSAVRAIREGK